MKGISIGVISEAGVPGVADPGADITSLAHKKGIKVIPLTGPSSILLALMASGLNGQNFCFHGYLPVSNPERSRKIADLEKLAEKFKQTQIFMETPFRNDKLFSEVLSICNEKTKLCVACDITLETEYIKTQSVHDWKKEKLSLHKRPSIFLIG
jgi:16S rRNA (cytidine1402-2'-O)-methyltransferase